jgi:hypothetical protein
VYTAEEIFARFFGGAPAFGGTLLLAQCLPAPARAPANTDDCVGVYAAAPATAAFSTASVFGSVPRGEGRGSVGGGAQGTTIAPYTPTIDMDREEHVTLHHITAMPQVRRHNPSLRSFSH